jgi:hypothetical protein
MSMPSLRERLARRLFGDIIDKAINAAVSIRIDDSPGWDPLSGGGPHDRPWSELRGDLDDALEAWRKNFMIRRIVTLVRTYAIGGGISISSKHREVEGFLHDFWTHPKNRIDRRLGPMCDELVRAGELFIALFTNPLDGISYVRLVPASRIQTIETDENDYERELRYGQLQEHTSELKWWYSPEHPAANLPPNGGDGGGAIPPVMLHYAINRPVGATRGESDLSTVLKWALRYSNWLEDRVRLNRIRTRSGMLDIKIDDDSQVEQKKYQLRKDDPLTAGIYIHGPGEEAILHNLEIRAFDATDDGKALRLAIAAGSGSALHYMGEGGDVNYATAKEMGEPTSRFYSERQQDLVRLVEDLVTLAHQRFLLATGHRPTADDDLKLEISVTEVARADNQVLAVAAKDIVTALTEMRAQGWIDDQTAIRWAFQFAGETISEEEIAEILETPKPAQQIEEEEE